jgi:aryl-phospho-beta-D-glucosidase BglC (GH1 family)
MTTKEREVSTYLRQLNFWIFIGEVASQIESESGMMNKILTERYATYSESHRQNLIEIGKKHLKQKNK